MVPATQPRKRVTYGALSGTVVGVSPEGIHFLVRFDDEQVPAWPQIVDGCCWFYAHELTGERS